MFETIKEKISSKRKEKLTQQLIWAVKNYREATLKLQTLQEGSKQDEYYVDTKSVEYQKSNIDACLKKIFNILKKGANPNAYFDDALGTTFLMYFCENDMLELIEIFDKFKVLDLDFQNKNGTTASMLACRYGSVNSLRFLKNYGADFSKKDWQGKRAIDYAKSCFDESKVARLLEILQNEEVKENF